MSNILAEIPIGEDTLVTYMTWEPDPDEVVAMLIKLASDVDDWGYPLRVAKRILRETTESYFAEQVDPIGDPWEPLNPAYATRKLKSGAPDDSILTRTGALRAIAGSDRPWMIMEHDIVFDVEALPFNMEGRKPANYGAMHQAGSQDATLAALNHKLRLGIKLTSAEIVHFTTITGRGKNLPQRQFIGVDDDAIEKIQEEFSDWLETLVEVDFGGISTPSPTAISGGQEFPIISYLASGQPIVSTPSGPRFGKLP